MSFDKMKVDELRKIADDFAVDVDPKDNKAIVIAKLSENGVTWDYYQKQLDDAEKAAANADNAPVAPVFDEPVEKAGEERVLLRMTRDNGTFEVRGVRFTRANPYAIVPESDADAILDMYEGFRIASPKEVREFYS